MSFSPDRSIGSRAAPEEQPLGTSFLVFASPSKLTKSSSSKSLQQVSTTRRPFMPTSRRNTGSGESIVAKCNLDDVTSDLDTVVEATGQSSSCSLNASIPALPFAVSKVSNASESVSTESNQDNQLSAERALRRSARNAGPSLVSSSHPPRLQHSPPRSKVRQVVNTTSTPASPPKIRAKVTEGLSARSRPKRPAHATAPVIVQRDSHHRDLAASQKSCLSLSREGENDGDSSFIFVDDQGDGAITEDERGAFDSVKVHVRLRPPKPNEACAWIPSVIDGTLSLQGSLAAQRTQPGASEPYIFDGVLTGSSNRPVYISVARPLVRAALVGFDAVVFAYGQTASGKTYTLGTADDEREPGIIPRAVQDIFRGIRQSSARREYLLRASYLEIFNEKVMDLLNPRNVPQVRDDRRPGRKGTFVQPLEEEIITSPAQVRELLLRGQTNRHVGATDWNERSSRSHTCLKITIESWERDADSVASIGDDALAGREGKTVRVSELSLIDLAGSEKYVSQGGARRTEGAHINKSLLTLGKVIFALSEKSSRSAKGSSAVSTTHIPYRDSKLTRILQNSLAGNARVAVVCTINPAADAVEESLSTLAFAKRVKRVALNAQRNEIGPGAVGAETQALLLKYQEEALALRKRVEELQSEETTVRLDDERLLLLQERLEAISSLVVRGGGEVASESDDDAQLIEGRDADANVGLFNFSEAPHVVQEKLYAAQTRIAQLERKIRSRPSMPVNSDEQAREALVARLRNQVVELEMVCEAQAGEAPPKIREDVEREWAGKVKALEEKLEEKERFLREMARDNEKLRKANKQLVRLATDQTASMVAQLGTPSRPGTPVFPAELRGTPGTSSKLGGRSPRPLPATERPASAMSSLSLRRRLDDEAGGSPTKSRGRGLGLGLGLGLGFSPLGPSAGLLAATRIRPRPRRSMSQDTGSLANGARQYPSRLPHEATHTDEGYDVEETY